MNLFTFISSFRRMYDRLNWYKTLKKENHRQGRDTLSSPNKLNSSKYFAAQKTFRKIYTLQLRAVGWSAIQFWIILPIKVFLHKQSENP